MKRVNRYIPTAIHLLPNCGLLPSMREEEGLLEEILEIYEISKNSSGCSVVPCASSLNHQRRLLIASAVYFHLQINERLSNPMAADHIN